MNKKEMLDAIKQARTIMDKVYYSVSSYNETHTGDKANAHMAEVERLLSWSDTCAMDAAAELKKFFDQDYTITINIVRKADDLEQARRLAGNLVDDLVYEDRILSGDVLGVSPYEQTT